MNITEHHVDIRTPDGVMDTWTFQPEGAGPWPAVILYQDVIGIRAELRSMASRIAEHGYFVALPNLFYRLGPLPPVDVKSFAVSGPERDKVLPRAKTIDGPKTMGDTRALLDYLASQHTTGRVGAVGYCMGGGYALRAAGTFPDRVLAAASFHGGALATDAPDSPHLLAPAMKGRLYVGVAEHDHSFDDAQRQRLDAALTAAKVDYTMEVYPGAKHGFAVVGHPVYDAAAAERHWQALLQLFDTTLKRPSPQG